MSNLPRVALLALVLAATGCTSYNIGENHDPDGSYAGATLNSPVTDQNPHPGGDSSYPASVSDQGLEPSPPQKADGR